MQTLLTCAPVRMPTQTPACLPACLPARHAPSAHPATAPTPQAAYTCGEAAEALGLVSTIYDTTFVDCAASIGQFPDGSPGITIRGGAMLVYLGANVLISGSEFTRCTCYSESGDYVKGGAITTLYYGAGRLPLPCAPWHAACTPAGSYRASTPLHLRLAQTCPALSMFHVPCRHHPRPQGHALYRLLV